MKEIFSFFMRLICYGLLLTLTIFVHHKIDFTSSFETIVWYMVLLVVDCTAFTLIQNFFGDD